MRWMVWGLSGLSIVIWALVLMFYLNTPQENQLKANMQPAKEHQLVAKSVTSNLFLVENTDEEIDQVDKVFKEEEPREEKVNKLQEALEKLPPGEPISVDDLLSALELNDI